MVILVFNTGGMNCYALVTNIVSPLVLMEIKARILKLTFRALREQGTPFIGMLFKAILMTSTGPWVAQIQCSVWRY